MFPQAGFRSHDVFENATEGTFGSHGAYLFAEVTNDGDTDTKFYPNPIQPDGSPNPAQPKGIPVKAGTTRSIPLAIYSFKADDAVTVVAYRS